MVAPDFFFKGSGQFFCLFLFDQTSLLVTAIESLFVPGLPFDNIVRLTATATGGKAGC